MSVTQPKDGGPAFPQPQTVTDGRVTHACEFALGGMSLRDWFASQYQPTPVEIAYAERHPDPGAVLAGTKFAHADAMLVERERDR